MRYDRVSFGGLMLGVCLFAAAGFAEESHLNGKWHLDSPEESSVKREKGAVRIRVLAERKMHGAYQKMLKLPEGKEYVFSARVSGDRGAMAYLSVKLFRGKKEIRRFSSPLNPAFSRTLSVAFSTKESGDVQILLRTIHSRENVGAEAVFRDLKLEEKTPPVTAELEIVPGYEVCSIYLNSPAASSEEQFRGAVFFREKGKTQWLPALDLVFVPTEKAARGSIVKLREGTEYEGKLEISDAGTTKIRHFRFRTKSPSVPIAKTVVLNRNNFNGHLLIQEEGAPDGYIRYTAEPGFVLRGLPGKKEVILLDNAKYVILDGLTIRGNQNEHGIHIEGGEHLQILNCDIAGYARIGIRRPELDGKYFNEKNRAYNYHSGIRIRRASDLLVERNFIHDPAAATNPWFYSHPAGPNAVYVEQAASLALRYNDFVGCDRSRWNDAVEGGGNGLEKGGFFRDAEIKGNFFALCNDDGIELDGGQMNCRMFGNRVEETFCGVSTAPCLKGPSYIFENLFAHPGDVFGQSNVALKNNFGNRKCGVGRIFFFNNTITGNSGGVSSFNASGKEGIKAVFINNLFALPARSAFHERIFEDPLYLSGNLFSGRSAWKEEFGRMAKTGTPSRWTTIRFSAPGEGDFSLDAESPGKGSAERIPNFLETDRADPGAPCVRELPLRPLGFRTEKSFLTFDEQKVADTVTLRAGPEFQGRFRIVKSEGAGYLSVAPSEGTIEPGKSVSLLVRIDPSKMTEARIHKAVFLVRAENGLSRPVLCVADNSRNAALAAKIRKNVIYASSVSPQKDGCQSLMFRIPKSGRFYLFVFDKGTSYAVNVSVNGGVPERKPFYAPAATRSAWSWKALRNDHLPNRPYELKQGELFRVDLLQRAGFRYDVRNAALAADPEELLFAPLVE